jgi:hypothetical protein
VSSPERAGAGAALALVGTDLAATLQSWREGGRHRFDPVRFRFIEALARRAAACHGAARALLDERVAELAAAYGRDVEQSGWEAGEAGGTRAASPRAGAPRLPTSRHATRDAASAAAMTAGQEARRRRGALADLVEQLARRAPRPANAAAPGAVADRSGFPPEPEALQHVRRIWARLSAERRLRQSLAKLPENAGPLNSQRLVHQSLMRMRELSPAYLQHFTTHVDALLWLESLQGARSGSAGKSAAAAR